MMNQQPLGLVVGRFQPLHLGHMEYIIAAFRRCTHLYIGVTHPDPEKYYHHRADVHRSQRSANPFSYDLRVRMVKGLMKDFRVEAAEYDVVPIRLESPEDCRSQVPLGATVFITIYDEWGDAKKKIFENMGFEVEVLWKRRETVTRGKDIRARIREGGEWQHLVPPSTYIVVQEWLEAGNSLNAVLKPSG